MKTLLNFKKGIVGGALSFLCALIASFTTAEESIYWSVTIDQSHELAAYKFPSASSACAAGLAEKESRHSSDNYKWRIEGDFYSGGSYVSTNMRKNPQDSDFVQSARSLTCKHEYFENAFPALGWRTHWPYSGATVRLNGSVCPQGTSWSADQMGCVAEDSPDLGECTCSSPCAANPIRISNGNKYQKEIDYRGRDAFPLTITRYYNSRGLGWRRMAHETLQRGYYVAENTISSDVVWRRPDGAVVRFGGARNLFVGNSVTKGKLTLSRLDERVWLIVDEQGIKRYFDNVQTLAENSAPSGLVSRLVDQHGNSHTYSYSASNRLEEVSHSAGDSLTYAYDSFGRVTSIATQNGDLYSYTYDAGYWSSIGSVTATINGSTQSRSYHYDENGKLLVGITDEKGVRYASWAYDEFSRAILSEHAGGADRTSLVFHDDGSTTVTNPLGKATTYHFSDGVNGSQVTQVEGHASENCAAANKNYTYYSNGLLETRTDWLGRVTSYEYNARGLQTRRTEAVGTSDERVVITEWHQSFYLPTKIIEPHRQTSFSYDSNGYLTNKTVSALP